MTLAAAELRVTPGAVSRQVRELEQDLDAQLFVRSNAGLVATPSGEVLAAAAREALELLAAATGNVRHRKSRRLRIGAYGYFVSRAIFPHLEALRNSIPDLDVEFVTSSSPVDLLPGAFDAVIATSGARSYSGIASRPLLPIVTVPVCSPSRVKRPIDFADVPLLHARPRPDDWSRWLEAAGFSSLSSARGHVFESISLAIEAAHHGLGAAIAIEGLLSPDLESKNIVVAHKFRRETQHHFAFQVETKNKHDRDLNKFADWIEETLAVRSK